jgi:hypothetical protein
MAHIDSCRTRKERFGLIWVEYSEPDQNCQDASHAASYTEEVK